jgi:hypothetical protein
VLYKDQIAKKALRFIEDKDIDEFSRMHEDLFEGKVAPTTFIQMFISVVGQKSGVRLLNFYLVSKSWKDKAKKQ